jgi:hypothetical protein
MSRTSKADQSAQWNGKAAVEFSFTPTLKVVVAKMTSHTMVTVKTQLADGLTLEPSLLLRTTNEAVGIRLQLFYDQ